MDATTGSSKALIGLSPGDKLTFTLVEQKSSKATMQVNNVSGQRIIFKVKTRRPKWWQVWPVQQMLDAGQAAEVQITLAEAECTRFYRDRTTPVDPKYRLFLVQSRVVTNAEFEATMALSREKRNEAIGNLWAPDLCPPALVNIAKLQMDFVYDDGLGGGDSKYLPEAGGVGGVPTSDESISARVDTIRDKLAAKARWATQEGATGASNGTGEDGGPVDDRAVFQELQALRKRFDAILEYTCHLTQERDAMASQIKELKRQQVRSATNKDESEGTEKGEGELSSTDKSPTSGFSLFFLVIISLVAFFLGRFLRGAHE